MPRTKSHSSTLATIKDLADKIIQAVTGAQSEYEHLIEDSERLKAIEPAINRFQNALKPAASTPPTEPPTGQAGIPSTEPPDEPPINPKKRMRRIKKKLSETSEEPPVDQINVG
jgi:hypothetical protein